MSSKQPGGFVAIPTHIMRNADLSPGARCVFGVILSYAWGGNACTASNSTLCGDAGISQSGLYEAVRTLKAAGLIKVEKGTNVRRRKIVAVPTGGLEVEGNEGEFASDSGFWNPSTEVDVGQRQVDEESLRSSSSARGEDQSKPKTPGAEHAPLLTGRLVDLMFVNDPKARIPKASSASYKRWVDSARLLIDADGRDPDETMKVIEWCQRDEFWKGNILSMPKFREKYPQLRARWLVHGRAKAVNEPGRPHIQQSTSSADLARAYGLSDRERRAGIR